jgi:hypothetical protein
MPVRYNPLLGLARRLAATGGARRLLEGIDLHSDNRMRERGMLAQAFEFKKINGVPGDYFEFGLWRGKTFIYAHQMRQRYRCDEMRLWGFDSFQGLPQIDEDDEGPENVWQTGQFTCSEREFRAILRRAGVPEQSYRLVPGYYRDSLNSDLRQQFSGASAAIVYIDCDLYLSTRQVLDFVAPLLVNGSIVCFDDYYNYKGNPEQGEQKALAEFLSGHKDVKFLSWLDYSPLGKSFIVRRGGEQVNGQ